MSDIFPPRPKNHYDDDEWDPYWKYQSGCGCELCEDYFDSMKDSLENDFWLDTGRDFWTKDEDDDECNDFDS